MKQDLLDAAGLLAKTDGGKTVVLNPIKQTVLGDARLAEANAASDVWTAAAGCQELIDATGSMRVDLSKAGRGVKTALEYTGLADAQVTAIQVDAQAFPNLTPSDLSTIQTAGAPGGPLDQATKAGLKLGSDATAAGILPSSTPGPSPTTAPTPQPRLSSVAVGTGETTRGPKVRIS
ncbi:MAG TPA: hypothetical protein VF020_07205 [Chthoniobacterales bacterium]